MSKCQFNLQPFFPHLNASLYSHILTTQRRGQIRGNCSKCRRQSWRGIFVFEKVFSFNAASFILSIEKSRSTKVWVGIMALKNGLLRELLQLRRMKRSNYKENVSMMKLKPRNIVMEAFENGESFTRNAVRSLTFPHTWPASNCVNCTTILQSLKTSGSVNYLAAAWVFCSGRGASDTVAESNPLFTQYPFDLGYPLWTYFVRKRNANNYWNWS